MPSARSKNVLIDSTVSRFTKGSMIARLGQRREAGGIRHRCPSHHDDGPCHRGNPFERVGALRGGFAGPGFGGPLPNLTNVFADELRWVRVEAVATAHLPMASMISLKSRRARLFMDYIKAQEDSRRCAPNHISILPGCTKYWVRWIWQARLMNELRG